MNDTQHNPYTHTPFHTHTLTHTLSHTHSLSLSLTTHLCGPSDAGGRPFVSCVLWFYGLDDTVIDSLSLLSRHHLAILSCRAFSYTFHRVKTISCGASTVSVHIRGNAPKEGQTQTRGQCVVTGNSIVVCCDHDPSAPPPTTCTTSALEYLEGPTVDCYGAMQVLEQEEVCMRGSSASLTLSDLVSEERTTGMLSGDGGWARRDLQITLLRDFVQDVGTGGTRTSIVRPSMYSEFVLLSQTQERMCKILVLNHSQCMSY